MSQTLRELLQGPEILVAPGAYDMVSARLITAAGYQAVYLTGYGQSVSHLGQPDVGLITLPEMVERARNMVGCIDVPLIADADTGYGNPLNTRRTIQLYEQAGVAALHIEDQVAPKRCGHTLGREVIPAEDMARKIAAAVDARRSDDFLVIARTDARTSLGLDEALRRARLYREAGADVLFVESPETVDEMKRICDSFPDVPLLANMVETGRTPLLSTQELQALGYSLAIWPAAALLAIVPAIRRVLTALKETGSTRDVMDQMVTFSELNQIVGFPEIQALDQKYSQRFYELE